MKIAYCDCFSGVSGDMCLGALTSVGVDFETLRSELSKLPVEGYELRLDKVNRSGISADNISVKLLEREQPVRHLADIEMIIDQSTLPETVKEQSKNVFRRLACVEAAVHGTTVDHVHFHEVGAVDAIVDVVGTVLGLHLLGVEKVSSSPLPMSKGLIRCMHGIIPSPAPATLEILKGVPIYGVSLEGELVTPTGAALIATLAESFCEFPAMVIEKIGYGSGKKVMDHPNLLRIVIGVQHELKAGAPFPCHGPHSHGTPDNNRDTVKHVHHHHAGGKQKRIRHTQGHGHDHGNGHDYEHIHDHGQDNAHGHGDADGHRDENN